MITVLSTAVHPAANDSCGAEVRHRLEIQAHTPFSLATTYTDSILTKGSAGPAAAAAATAAALVREGPGAAADRLEQESSSWWRSFWRNASISLPDHPGVEYCSGQYMYAAM